MGMARIGRLPWRVLRFVLLVNGRRRSGRFGRRDRKEVLEEIKTLTIKTLTVDIAEKLDEHTHALCETAFRHAAET